MGTSEEPAWIRRPVEVDRLIVHRIAAVLAGLLLALGLVLAPAGAVRAADTADTADGDVLHLFWSEGCPYCEAELAWLEGLVQRYPTLEVRTYELSGSDANRALWVQMTTARGVEPTGVPTTVLGEHIWVGFDADRIGPGIEAAVAAAVAEQEPSEPATEPAAPDRAAVLSLPLVGEIDLASRSLIVSTLLIGFVDGFNPCSLWVLSLLLALVLHTGSRRRVLIVGGTFLAVTTLLYGVYIAGLYSVLSYIAYVPWIRVVVAIIAATFGILGVKDFLAFRRGPSLSIPESRKPGLYRRMRAVTAADRPLPAVVAGTAAMAVGVSLIETPCTAGFPVIWTNLLAVNDTATGAAVVLFGLYMLVFLLDELAIFGVAVVTMRAAKLQERHGRLLKLVGGVVMLTLAGVMLVDPALLESVVGTTVVFGGAGLVAAAIVGVDRMVRRSAHSPG